MNTKKKYSQAELEEFKTIIVEKLQATEEEISSHKHKLQEMNDTLGTTKIQPLEDSPEVEERETLNYQIGRSEKFRKDLREALQRIHNGTYGICATTGALIPKERLRLVPHTTHSVAAKLNREPRPAGQSRSHTL